LDRMLFQRPTFRPIPADLSRYFQKLQQRMDEESGTDTHTPGKTQS